MSSDEDGFNRWSAAQELAVRELNALITQAKRNEPLSIESQLLVGFKHLLSDESLDKSNGFFNFELTKSGLLVGNIR